MARAELKLNLNALKTLEGRFKSPELEAKLQAVPGMKEVAALVAQAIADNFAQEGPGWEPLKGATIRNSVAKNQATKALLNDAYMVAARKVGAIKTVKRGKYKGKQVIDRRELRGNRKTFYEHVDKYIENIEAMSRKSAEPGEALGNRQILRRTSLLYQTVTTPGYSGSSVTTFNKGYQAMSDEKRKKAKAQVGRVTSGQNINRVQGSNLVWGTNLIYAATHNEGRGPIPKREFLVIREAWMARLTRFVFKLMTDIVKNHVEGK